MGSATWARSSASSVVSTTSTSGGMGIAYLRALYKPAGGDRFTTQSTYMREEMYKLLATDKGR